MNTIVANENATLSLVVISVASDNTVCYVQPHTQQHFDLLGDFQIFSFDPAVGPASISILDTAAASGRLYYFYDTLVNVDEVDSGISATVVEVPVIGEVVLPDWALASPEMAVFFLGFATAAGVLLVRQALRWYKRADGVGVSE